MHHSGVVMAVIVIITRIDCNYSMEWSTLTFVQIFKLISITPIMIVALSVLSLIYTAFGLKLQLK